MNIPNELHSIALFAISASGLILLLIIWRAWRSYKKIIKKMRLRSILNDLQERSVVGKVEDTGPPVILASEDFMKSIREKYIANNSDYTSKLLDINIILFCIQNDPFLMDKLETDGKVKEELHSIFSYFSNGTPSNERLLTAIKKGDRASVTEFLDSTVDYLDFHVQQNIHPEELVSHYAVHALIETKLISSRSILFKYYHRYILNNTILKTSNWLCLAAFSRIPSVSEALNKPIAIRVELNDKKKPEF